MPKTAPKLIDDILNEVHTGNESLNTSLPHIFSNKVYLYGISSFISLVIILFTLSLNQLSPEFIDQLSLILDKIGFLNLKLSYKFIEDLKLPNPVSVLVLASNSAFILYAITDTVKNRENPSRNHFKESYAASYSLHLLFLLVLFVSLFIAYTPKPKIKVNKLEFITTQEAAKEKPPPNTKKKSARASIDQGKNDPKKPVSPVKKNPGKQKQPKQKATPKKQVSKAPPKPRPAPKPRPKGKSGGVANPDNKATGSSSPGPIKRAPSKSSAAPKAIKTGGGNSSSKVAEKALSQIPNPSVPGGGSYKPNISKNKGGFGSGSSGSGLPTPKNYGGFSRGSGGGTGGGSGSGANGNSNAAPKSAEQISGSGPSGQDLVDRLGNIRIPDNIDVSFGSGGYGNPAPNQYGNRAPSTASIPDISFGPYMAKIQEKIKQRWRPPKGAESKRIVVMFSINRDGSLSNLKINQTNANSLADTAALNAIRSAAPFPPLPPGSAPSIDIEFTFDYNVFKRNRY
ncbi:MAG: TonB C-terminal domain-containing protein [Candidatus Caenarcaniphilales bacterium]|nr:TonB C-terminal domain-containing protein [Candidatus Caenarcaniphilales bacterium]